MWHVRLFVGIILTARSYLQQRDEAEHKFMGNIISVSYGCVSSSNCYISPGREKKQTRSESNRLPVTIRVLYILCVCDVTITACVRVFVGISLLVKNHLGFFTSKEMMNPKMFFASLLKTDNGTSQ